MNVYIVGSCGYIGTRLTEYFLKKHIGVRGLSIGDVPGIEQGTGLVSEGFSLPNDIDAVIYLAQSPYYRMVPEMSWHLMNMNVVSAIKLAELSRAKEVKHFIYTSTGNVYSPSFEAMSESHAIRRDDWYALSKIHAEEAISLFKNDMKITILRLFGIYGPGQKDKLVPNIVSSIINHKPVFLERNLLDSNDKDGLKITLCYIDDLLNIFDGIIRSKDAPLLNVASDEVLSIRQLSHDIATILGIEVSIECSCNVRNTNLIADISLLKEKLNPSFTKFSDGILNTILSLTNY